MIPKVIRESCQNLVQNLVVKKSFSFRYLKLKVLYHITSSL